MRFLKLAVISILVLFVVLTGITSLFPSDVVVSRAVVIGEPADTVRKFISDYNKWNDWMEGAKGNELKVVAKDSNNAFFGTVVIRMVSRKNYEWKYEWKNRNSLQIATIQIIPHAERSCTVQWQFEQHLHWYPWEKFGSLMNDKIIGSALEASLDNLKKLTEKIN